MGPGADTHAGLDAHSPPGVGHRSAGEWPQGDHVAAGLQQACRRTRDAAYETHLRDQGAPGGQGLRGQGREGPEAGVGRPRLAVLGAFRACGAAHSPPGCGAADSLSMARRLEPLADRLGHEGHPTGPRGARGRACGAAAGERTDDRGGPETAQRRGPSRGVGGGSSSGVLRPCHVLAMLLPNSCLLDLSPPLFFWF